MAHVWIKCLTIVRAVDEHAVEHTYYPNDWCRVGMHQARLLVAQGSAEIQNSKTLARVFELDGCGIVAYGPVARMAEAHTVRYPEIPVHISDDGPCLAFDKTLLLDPAVGLSPTMLPVGFYRLSRGWWMAAPVLPHSGSEYLTAEMIGAPEEQARTRAVVRDLRCPVYDPRAVFVSRRAECKAVIDQWLEEREEPGVDSRLAFLRAFYTHKPKMCALPGSWYGR